MNASLNHGWCYVKLDGEWYHIDPTWDDTRSPKSGKTSRVHFMKNDAEFATNHGSSWDVIDSDEVSTSTKYSSWFLRDIVGKMSFEDGLWYYYDDSMDMIVRASLTTGDKEAVVDCSGWSGESLVDVTGNVITMVANGATQSIEIGEGIVVPEGDTAVSELPVLADVDLSDFSNWMSGNYNYQNGTYEADSSRLAVSSYVICEAGKEYEVTVSNSKYQVLIRELSGNMSVVASRNLKSGSSFTTGIATKYLAISIYAPNLSGLSYGTYEALFEDGFEVSIAGTADEEVVEPEVNEGDVDAEEDSEASGELTEDLESVGSSSVGMDLNDFSNWISGVYHYQTGLYTEDRSRICLKDYVSGEAGAEYEISISNSKYNVLIRELNADKKVVASHDLVDGKSFTTKSTTEYLAVSIYAPSVWGMTYEKYAALFENGMTVSITTEAVIEDNTTQEEIQGSESESEDTAADEKTVEAWDFREFSNWQTGMYHYSTGKYCSYAQRICLVDYLEFGSERYVANITDSTYKLLVRELDENQKFIKSVTLADGASYTPSSSAKYLAISLYNATNDWGMTYAKYQQMFAEGFYAELIAK